MKLIPVIILLVAGQTLFGQTMPLTFTNNKNAYYNKTASKDTFFVARVNEIKLNNDSTFEFWSRPHVSCLTWHGYKGIWKKEKDTLFFYDNYEVVENDMRITYNRDTRRSFRISFKTDNNSHLKNRKLTIQYVYDYEAHLQDSEKAFSLKSGNLLEIPFEDIPNLNKLASIKIEYQFNFSENRYGYLTQNNTINKKQANIPNIIGVEFVEKPKKEIVYRIIKAIIQKDTLTVVSTTKTKTTLPDYYRDIEFEDSYALTK